jgi:hypothetical protein
MDFYPKHIFCWNNTISIFHIENIFLRTNYFGAPPTPLTLRKMKIMWEQDYGVLLL